MLKNYFKIAWRNLLKGKAYSFINITGLATGMAVALLIGLWIWDEISFDSYYKNHSRMAQVLLNQTDNGEVYTGGTIAMPLGDALKTNHGADFKYISLTSWNNDHLIGVKDKKISGAGRWVQADFPEMLTLKMIQGQRDALKNPSSVLIAESLAKSLFGNGDPINETIKLDNKVDLKVAGVYEDMPQNTTFYNTRLLLPWDNAENRINKFVTNWSNHCGQLFVQLRDGADFDKVTAKIKNIPTPHIKEWKEDIMLQPMDKLHLYDEFVNSKAVGGRIQFVWLIGGIGFFVLLLACINFMNLATARSEKRAKEVGIRKAVGSLRHQLIGQFLSESILVTFLSFALSLLLLQLSLPFFNDLAGKKMSIAWDSSLFWLLAIGFTLLTGIISGSYPAFYLSAFKPIKVLKGVFRAGRFASMPRKVLVVVQFTVSIALIIGTIIVFRQIQYAKDRPIGFTREGLIAVPLAPALYGRYEVLRNDLLQTGVVENMAESSQSPSHFGNNNSIDWEGRDPGKITFFRDVNVTADFGKTIGWQIKAGRDFSRDLPDSNSAILNETGAAIVGFKDPVGRTIEYGKKTYTIVGIAKDMLTQSPYDPLQPAVFFCDSWLSVITIRIKPTVAARVALASIQPVFKKYNPDNPFEYKFVDDAYAVKFSNEERIGNLATFFAILAIFISCLGLFGLASFVAEQRTKEIGVRKVLGATVFNLWKMLSKDFVLLVAISCVIAIPLAWYYLNQWLQNYNYHTTISWWIFIVPVIGALVITLLTVSFQAIKAALANPVKSLRTE